MADNFYETLAMKALEHPQGLEVIKQVRELFRETQVKQQPKIEVEELPDPLLTKNTYEERPSDPLLKKNAYDLATALGIFTPKHINHMTNSELEAWISENSALL